MGSWDTETNQLHIFTLWLSTALLHKNTHTGISDFTLQNYFMKQTVLSITTQPKATFPLVHTRIDLARSATVFRVFH